MRIYRHEDIQTVLVVATDLVLNPDDPFYNGEAVSDLAEAVTTKERRRFVPVRRNET
jgi:hypothetical protein